jgi:hypothetical protein
MNKLTNELLLEDSTSTSSSSNQIKVNTTTAAITATTRHDNNEDNNMMKISKPLQRLIERTIALELFIERHDQIINMIKNLKKFYDYTYQQKFTEKMMITDRGKLSERV